MTRHQVWRARERARFLNEAEWVRVLKKLVPYGYVNPPDRWQMSVVGLRVAQVEAEKRGIPEPFLG